MPAVVSIKMQATDEASAKIAKVKKEISGLGQSGGGGFAGGAMDALVGALPQLGAAAAVTAIAATSWQLGELGATALRTRESFASVAEGAGLSGAAILAAMRTATSGTISDSELMLAANRALMLGVVTNADEMGGLMAAAIERGRSLGVSAGQAVGDIITGIGRMSPEILDNLGIVGAAASIDRYAQSLGLAADQLTDVQKKQALVNAVLASASGGPVANDAAAAFERMDASITNAKESLGIMFSPAISAIADKLAQAVSGLTADMERGAKADQFANLAGLSETLQMGMAELQQWQNAMAVAQVGPSPEGIATAQANLDRLGKAMADVGVQYNAAAQMTGAPLLDIAQLQNGVFAFRELSTAITTTGAAATGADPQMLKLATDLGVIGQMAISTTTDLAGMRAEISRLQGVANAVGGARNAGISQAQGLAIRAINAGANPEDVIAMVNSTALAIDGLTLSSGESAGAAVQNQMAIEGQLNPLDNLVSGLEAANQAASKLASGGLSDMEKQFDDLKGKVQSVITGAMDLGVAWPGMNGEGAGGDGIAENAKRLAAIANEGLTGQPWLEEFKTEAPDTYADLMLKIAAGMNPQAAAQQLMSEFQAGMRPELLDREMIKERIKQMLLGDANASALAQEIATELATEMGVSIPAALAAAQSALGVAPATGKDGVTTGADNTGQGNSAGVTFQAGFVAGFASNDVALKILSGIDKGFKDNVAAITASGKAVGLAWGNNFMSTVEGGIPPALIAVLSSLVTPQVWAQIQTNQGLTAPAP